MPEEREQRIHFVRLSPCSLRISGSRQRDVGWGWVSHAPWSPGSRRSASVRVLCFGSRSRVRVYTCVSCGIRLGVPGWPLMPYLISAPLSRSGRLPPKLRASCAPADPGPRPAATPAPPPPLPLAPWRLGLGSASCIAIGLSRRAPRAGLHMYVADVARPHCAMASIGIMSGSNSQIEYPQGPIRDQFPASLTNTRARQPPEPQACAGSAFCWRFSDGQVSVVGASPPRGWSHSPYLSGWT